MAWSYTLDFGATAAGRRNQVRLRLGDTDTNRQLLQDEEIDHFLDVAGDAVRAATRASAVAVLARFSTRPDSQRVGEISTGWADLRARMLALIAEIDRDEAMGAAPFAGGTSVADIDDRDADTDRPQPVFHEDSHRQRQTRIGPASDETGES